MEVGHRCSTRRAPSLPVAAAGCQQPHPQYVTAVPFGLVDLPQQGTLGSFTSDCCVGGRLLSPACRACSPASSSFARTEGDGLGLMGKRIGLESWGHCSTAVLSVFTCSPAPIPLTCLVRLLTHARASGAPAQFLQLCATPIHRRKKGRPRFGGDYVGFDLVTMDFQFGQKLWRLTARL